MFDYRAAYPAAMALIERDLDELVEHLRFRSDHRKRIRSTNLLERTSVEVRRRTKVIGRLPGETSALCLIWAALELASRGWRGVVTTPKSVAEIERPRRGLTAGGEPTTTNRAEQATAAQDRHKRNYAPHDFTRTIGRDLTPGGGRVL